MSAKITLYSDEELIASIKQYAKEHNTSVSKLVNRYFKALVEFDKNKTQEAEGQKGKISHELCGILKDSDMDEEDYHKYLEEKYL